MKKGLLIALALLTTMIFAGTALAGESSIDLKARDLVINNNSDTLGCRFENSNYYCLINPDGSKLTNEIYNSVYSVSGYPYFKVETDSKDGIHNEGLVDDQGKVIVPVMYADVNVISDRWASGIKLISSSADDKDYTYSNYRTGEKSFYRIDKVDFYYLGSLAGTLSRSDYDGYPTAYGDYLCVQTREKARVFYNSRMEKSSYQPEYSGEYSSSYKNRKTTYIHNGTGQKAFETGCTLIPDEVGRSVIYENGKFLNLQGEEPFRAAQNYDSVQDFHGDYAVVSMNSKKGLINTAGEEVIPVEYESIGNYEDTYLEYGAISAEKDGKFGFLDATGNVTCDFVYSKDIVRNYGILGTIKNLDGTIIVLSGLAGELPEHYSETDMSSNARAFVAKNAENELSLIDATGRVLIPFTDVRYIYANHAATVAFYTMGNHTYRIFTFSHDMDVPVKSTATVPDSADELREMDTAASETDGAWTCSNGHAGNTGKFCPECGEAKPAQDVTCPSCGTVYPTDQVPNFCPEDGTKLK